MDKKLQSPDNHNFRYRKMETFHDQAKLESFTGLSIELLNDNQTGLVVSAASCLSFMRKKKPRMSMRDGSYRPRLHSPRFEQEN